MPGAAVCFRALTVDNKAILPFLSRDSFPRKYLAATLIGDDPSLPSGGIYSNSLHFFGGDTFLQRVYGLISLIVSEQNLNDSRRVNWMCSKRRLCSIGRASAIPQTSIYHVRLLIPSEFTIKCGSHLYIVDNNKRFIKTVYVNTQVRVYNETGS